MEKLFFKWGLVDEMLTSGSLEPLPIISNEISLENGGDPGSNPGGSIRI